MKKLREYFQVGRVIYSKYWQSYDLVLGFSDKPKDANDWRQWFVTVVQCDKDGNRLVSAEPREHCTNPFI